MTSVVEALAQAAEHGVVFMLEAGRVRCRNTEALPPDLLQILYEQLPELREVLSGARCRFCARPISWRAFDSVAFADGRGAHLGCYERVETERQAARRQRRQPDPTEQAA